MSISAYIPQLLSMEHLGNAKITELLLFAIVSLTLP
jgi:hypothetical protein